jgi:signal transduction histidine kinase
MADPSTLAKLADAGDPGTALRSPQVTLSRWMGWRLRLLVIAALIGCVALVVNARWIAEAPTVPAQWQINPHGELVLVSSPLPALQPYVGDSLAALQGNQGSDPVRLTRTATSTSPRWVVNDNDRRERTQAWQALSNALSQPEVSLTFAQKGVVRLAPAEGGVLNLPGMLWLLSCLALMLYLVAMVVVLTRPTRNNALFALMASCQAVNLVFQGVESSPLLGLPSSFVALQAWLPMVLDLCTAAAMLQAAAVHPRRLAGARWVALLAWAWVGLLSLLLIGDALPRAWWWVQFSGAAAAVCVLCLQTLSQRQQPHPFSLVLRRFTSVGLSGWSLLTLVAAIGAGLPQLQNKLVPTVAMMWCVFFSCLLVMLPFVSRAQILMREFTLLALVSSVATILDLGFVAIFSFSQFTSLTLALFLALGVYVGARQWVLDRVRGNQMHTTERMFEQLYRIARAVEAHPERSEELMLQLLCELFDPMEASIADKPCAAARVIDSGSTLILPLPLMDSSNGTSTRSIEMRYAHRGRRLFHSEDATLADRIVDQLRRAVAFDRAVEQGRSEERMRLAQDLHDDIGARLLTLMYQASTPEMEAYVRHTLQDLKTLTRGLAVANQRLSHAAAEWKADLTQRLQAADVVLRWKLDLDEDVLLSVVQWSALTRVLRELVSNVMSHSHAQTVEIDIALQHNQLRLSVSDDGIGRNPQVWSHGLGLGGVRKRIKQLGGSVQWQEQPSGCGIRCEVVVDGFSSR